MELRGGELCWFPLGSGELRKNWKCIWLGNSYDFCKWSRPKSDPTVQMEIQMQMQVQMQVQTQFQCKCKCTCTCKFNCKRNFNAKVVPKLIRQLHKIIKISGENECFLKTDQCDSKVTLIWSKCTQSDPKAHKVTPKWPQSDHKTTPKRPQKGPKVSQSGPQAN